MTGWRRRRRAHRADRTSLNTLPPPTGSPIIEEDGPFPEAADAPGQPEWRESIKIGAVAAWVRYNADQHLSEVERSIEKMRRDADRARLEADLAVQEARRTAAAEIERATRRTASAEIEAQRLERVAATHAADIVRSATIEAAEIRAQAQSYAHLVRGAAEQEIEQWFEEADAEAAAILARAERVRAQLLSEAESARAASLAKVGADRAGLLEDAQQLAARNVDHAAATARSVAAAPWRAESELRPIVALINALLAEADEEISERRRLAIVAADEITAIARLQAAAIAPDVNPRSGSEVDEIAARRVRTEVESQRRIS